MKKSILTLLFSCSFFILIAQETNFITINFSPQNIVLRIDGAEVISLNDKTNPYILTLPIGTHKVEAWSKGFEIQEYEIDVSSTEQKPLNIGMRKLNPEFQAYLDAQKKYSSNKFKDIGIIGLSTVFAASSLAFLAQGSNEKNKLFTELKNAKTEYSGAINAFELNIAEQKHTEALKAIKNRRLFGYISGALAVGASTLTIRHFKKKKAGPKIEVPVYEEINPFVFYNYQKKNKTQFRLNSNGLVLNF